MTEQTKILTFPKSKVVREVPEELIQARKAKIEQKLADAIVDDITSFILSEMDNNSIDVENTAFHKDFILVADAIKACVYRHFAIEHHLHTFIDNNVKLIEGDFSGLSPDELKEKIESLVNDLNEAKEKIDNDKVE